jgi:2-polyprenyl-6-hydroxyphenyl methylase/3-demethylubiquinone-9 3-methyltransferase
MDLPTLPGTVLLEIRCKCCGGAARYFGSADFNDHCLRHQQHVLPRANVPVPYHRCATCGFLFTAAFDRFTPDDFRRYIYNEQYILADPEYAEARPRRSAEFVARILPAAKGLRILDYGGGNGVHAQTLRTLGFANIEVYDPFVEQFSRRPQGQFDLVTCSEVVEHSPDPRGVLGELCDLIHDDGMIFFTTLLQPPDIHQLGTSWWYLAPRNGHVSLFTTDALIAALRPRQMRMGSFDAGGHVLLKKPHPPPFARHLFPP